MRDEKNARKKEKHWGYVDIDSKLFDRKFETQLSFSGKEEAKWKLELSSISVYNKWWIVALLIELITFLWQFS